MVDFALLLPAIKACEPDKLGKLVDIYSVNFTNENAYVLLVYITSNWSELLTLAMYFNESVFVSYRQLYFDLCQHTK